jgi:CRP/FNR family transcriptional regulator, cyclic AMP receptor protein
MQIAGPTRVHLLDADSDLARGLDAGQAQIAERQLVAPVLQLRRGPWVPSSDLPDGGPAPFALLVLDGVVIREAMVGDHPSAELLGPGDLLRSADEPDRDELLPRSFEWTVLHPSRVALLDADLLAAASQWPSITVALLERAVRRADRLVVLQAITHLTRVDDRLLALLWHLAERWGRVVPDGIALSLRLPHRTLAGMVGARRPSVTTAIGQLIARGAVERRSDGAWILRGGPPAPRTADIARTAEALAFGSRGA